MRMQTLDVDDWRDDSDFEPSSSEDSEIGNSDEGSEQDLIEPEQQKQNARGQKTNDFEKNQFVLPFMA